MRRQSLPVAGIEHGFRAQVCAHCARGTPAEGPNGRRACEDTCGQFQSIPRLLWAAAWIDPMIGSVPDALKRHMPVTGGAVNWPPRRRQKLISLITESLRA